MKTPTKSKNNVMRTKKCKLKCRTNKTKGGKTFISCNKMKIRIVNLYYLNQRMNDNKTNSRMKKTTI